MSKRDGRPSWDQYFMEIAHLVAKRSTCRRRQVGAVLVKNKRILATGYNGAPSGLQHCLEAGCLREELGIPSGQRLEICRGIHAEQNAIIQAALHGVSTEGSTLYCTDQPCSQCTKMLINAGVKEIIYVNDYPDDLALQLLEEAKLPIRKWAPESFLDSPMNEG
ncbi:MAG: cytidine deaminase [Firmicutes bacterium]|jgi:dCMP deaminase|nr:cytidine deaminase [Bacillota bacterium]